jgi:hypothetical protein
VLISLINQYGTEKIREIRKNFKDQIINNCAADQSSLESIIQLKGDMSREYLEYVEQIVFKDFPTNFINDCQ